MLERCWNDAGTTNDAGTMLERCCDHGSLAQRSAHAFHVQPTT